jgi:hypothetical protein
MTTIFEAFGSRDRSGQQDGTGSTAELFYIIEGTTDDQVAIDLAANHSPISYYRLVRDTIDVNQVAPNRWEATVRYVDPDKPDEEEPGDHVEVGEGVFSFDTTGEIIHIDAVKKGKYTEYFHTAAQAVSFKGAIGVHSDGVDGVDIVSPGLRLTYRTRLAKEDVTLQWIKNVAAITGTTNNNTFYTFAKGEMLFLGMQGEQTGETDPEMTFNFVASSNWPVARTFETLDGDVDVFKDGHQYLWNYYIKGKDDTAKKTIPVPHGIIVDTVYEESDFANLGIGTQ